MDTVKKMPLFWLRWFLLKVVGEDVVLSVLASKVFTMLLRPSTPTLCFRVSTSAEAICSSNVFQHDN